MGEILLVFAIAAFCVLVFVVCLIQDIVEKVEQAARRKNRKEDQRLSPEEFYDNYVASQKLDRRQKRQGRAAHYAPARYQSSPPNQSWDRWSQQEEEPDQEAYTIPGLSPEATRLAQYAASIGQLDEFLDDPGDFIESLW